MASVLTRPSVVSFLDVATRSSDLALLAEIAEDVEVDAGTRLLERDQPVPLDPR